MALSRGSILTSLVPLCSRVRTVGGGATSTHAGTPRLSKFKIASLQVITSVALYPLGDDEPQRPFDSVSSRVSLFAALIIIPGSIYLVVCPPNDVASNPSLPLTFSTSNVRQAIDRRATATSLSSGRIIRLCRLTSITSSLSCIRPRIPSRTERQRRATAISGSHLPMRACLTSFPLTRHPTDKQRAESRNHLRASNRTTQPLRQRSLKVLRRQTRA